MIGRFLWFARRIGNTRECHAGRRFRRSVTASTMSAPECACTNIPTAASPSSTGRAAWFASLQKLVPMLSRPTPLNSAQPRRTCGRHGQASGSPTPPTGEQNQKKRTFDVPPKPDNFIRYRQPISKKIRGYYGVGWSALCGCALEPAFRRRGDSV